MAAETPQRSYRAPCPGCGAPVEFRSAQSTFAVCSYCQSTVVRDGETLSRLGRMGELFEDYSPLQLMASGEWQGRGFTLVGRLQYRGGSGAWTEWNALFGDGSSGWLAEDNGSYVFALPRPVGRELPEAARFRVGGTTAMDGKTFEVTANETVALVSAQGELPRLPPLQQAFAMVELRSADGEVLSIDYGSQPPAVSRGREVRLEELKLAGLKGESTRESGGRQFACPHCGAPVAVRLATSKSVTCPACNSIIDLAQGLGGELRHAEQDEPVRPLIPLGSKAVLQGTHWQLVGYQHRMGWEPGDDEERFGWDEYLLFNRKRGFVFLVDAEDGWSLVKPATGAPALSQDGRRATYLKTQYTLQASYFAETNYVAGEFYWPVERGQRTFNRDFARGQALLSQEETPRERTWSVGSKLHSDTVAQAFGIADRHKLMERADVGPTTSSAAGGGIGCATVLMIILLLLVVFALMRACQDDRGSGYGGGYGGGGSYGGYSSGGGHK